ncbi:GIY-YIG nuclease family protein [Asticcacaulis sp. BYS171W]|uniref:GIY-YIG nuclease family protein n=1 Tax=Asticcacaulis aquaticus TaxID=2984212 RepID=A0ABT5HY26_9CAUL|nr:GIY-YIG nuclease family protein [Asticcacaulis aquaticus]MDC7684974.1 GIY-YIG nuclease family protein [Asticcacaulis aquaticus]
MDSHEKKAAIAAYKERKSISGIYAVICNATGEVWVGASRNLESQQNGLWFTLRLGHHIHKPLQAAFSEHGAAAFRYEELDRIPDDYSDMARKDELKRRKALWQARLQADGLL